MDKFNLGSNSKIEYRDTDAYIEFNDQNTLGNISYRIYNDPKYWWLILKANDYQIEFDIEPGELLRIPYPLADALNDLGIV